MTDQTTAPGFKVDWGAIYAAWLQENDDEYSRTYALPIVIDEYTRQLAKAGMVVVRAETLERLRAYARLRRAIANDTRPFEQLLDLADQANAALDAITADDLATADHATPEGDGG